ncbi:MAG: hypothetical protein JWM95_3380 [Gemmatimonadetes bacterium]|nr:hypothetical protein [Gemmatimonadota bacterium]
MTFRLLLVAAFGATCASRLEAQVESSLRVGAVPQQESNAGQPPSVSSAFSRAPTDLAPIFSAIVPGLGQAQLRQDRFVAYVAAEAYIILQLVKSNREKSSNADTYRSIARDIARRSVPNAPDTTWKYYEQMGEYAESGVFSSATSGVTVPETDPTTFNGFQWLQARRNVGGPLNDAAATGWPHYAEALEFYERRAVRPPFRWSWEDAQLERDLYQRAIKRSDAANRHITSYLIALAGNHVLSTIDAFASVRLLQAAGGDMRLSASIPLR